MTHNQKVEKRRGKKMFAYSMIGIVLVLVAMTGISFYWAQARAKERFAVYEAKAEMVETSFGTLSYIDEGEGEPILGCHGICGGYDQALDTLGDKTEEYRVIAPSRFGYPGSDMPEDAGIKNQTDAFVELLDALQIEKTYVLGTSAGGASAIRFALEHPERTKGLILYCSGYPAMEEADKELTYVGPPSFLCHDFPMWFFSPFFGPIMGMDRQTVERIMPFAKKQEGIVADAKIANTDMVNHWQDYDMSKLEVPVLIFHAKDDKLADYDMAKAWADKISDCSFYSFETGGHLMVGNSEKIDEGMKEFITAATPSSSLDSVT